MCHLPLPRVPFATFLLRNTIYSAGHSLVLKFRQRHEIQTKSKPTKSTASAATGRTANLAAPSLSVLLQMHEYGSMLGTPVEERSYGDDRANVSRTVSTADGNGNNSPLEDPPSYQDVLDLAGWTDTSMSILDISTDTKANADLIKPVAIRRRWKQQEEWVQPYQRSSLLSPGSQARLPSKQETSW